MRNIVTLVSVDPAGSEGVSPKKNELFKTFAPSLSSFLCINPITDTFLLPYQPFDTGL